MAAFAMFSLKAPSLLAFAKERAEGNVPTSYGMQPVPCDTARRARLAPVSPKWLRPVCTRVLRPLQRGIGMSNGSAPRATRTTSRN